MFQHVARLSDPTFSGLVAVMGLLVVLIIVKLISGKKSTKRAQESFDVSSKTSKKRKAKKQKLAARDKKTTDSPKARKDNKNSKISSLVETKKPNFEEKSDKRKDVGKSKNKSKKKKAVVAAKTETIQESFVKDHNFDDGSWKTVSTKEQREQIKREKRKLEEATTALSKDSMIDKIEPVPLVQPHKPIHNPAIAKGIAPRFARAAGAEWQEKPTFSIVNQPLQSKRPMPPASVPGTIKPQIKQSTVTQQTWNQGNPTWQENLGWPVSTASALPSSLMNFVPSDPTRLLSMAPPSDKNSPDGWPQSGVSWQSSEFRDLERFDQHNYQNSFRSTSLLTRDQSSSPSHSSSSDEVFSPNVPIKRNPYKSHIMRIQSEPALICQSYDTIAGQNEKIQRGSHNSQSSWEMNGDDWVHVNGASNNKIESWQASETKSKVKDDVWTFEPEGFSLPQQQVDSDPWGMEVVEQDTGDWSAPTASWDNANSEWTAPSPAKAQPTYIDESSEEETTPFKIPSNSSQQETHTVVGISQETSNQKKSRRRRKKKNPAPEQTTPTPEPETDLPEPVAAKAEESAAEEKPVETSEGLSLSFSMGAIDPRIGKNQNISPQPVPG